MIEDIQVVTNPKDVGKLLSSQPKMANPPQSVEQAVNSGASVEEILARIEADEAIQHSEGRQPNITPTPPSVNLKTPLQLRYQFIGVDPNGHPVKTITINTDAGYYAIAYCLAEDKEIQSLQVAPLPDLELFLRDEKTGEMTPLQKPRHQTNIATVNSKNK